MTNPTIRPTIGRRVWFRPSVAYLASNPTMTQLNPEQAMDAGIVYVHHDHMVNLQVADHVGRQFMVPSVPLLAGAWDAGCDLHFAAEWMPYQKGQAAKTDANVKTSTVAREKRDCLEFALVSGAAASLAQCPAMAGEIATGIKTVLNTLHPVPAVSNPHNGAPRDARDMESDPQAVLCTKPGEPLKAAAITLPVRDPGPDSLERDIQARASVAPRVTPADIEAEIVGEYSTTLDKALAGCPLLEGMDRVTLAVVVLKNGTKLVGVNYGAIDPANHSSEVGKKEARAQAIEQAWPLLGFRLRDKLHAQVRCQGERCMATTQNGLHHSRECLEEAGRNQGWTPTAEELAAAGPSAPLNSEA